MRFKLLSSGYCLLHRLCSCILIIKQDIRNIDPSVNMAAHNTPCAGTEIDDIWSHGRLSHDLYGKI